MRDRGLALIARVNRWMIAGAVGLSGVLSLAAANAFKGHPRTAQSQTAESTGATAQQPQPSSGGGSLGQPAQAPAPAVGGGGTVVSGGS